MVVPSDKKKNGPSEQDMQKHGDIQLVGHNIQQEPPNMDISDNKIADVHIPSVKNAIALNRGPCKGLFRIKNFGNTGFLNSIVQLLRMSDDFVQKLSSLDFDPNSLGTRLYTLLSHCDPSAYSNQDSVRNLLESLGYEMGRFIDENLLTLIGNKMLKRS
jgi:hypothetical protein